MARNYIKDMAVGDKVEEYYLVRSKRNLTTRAGKPYLDLDLADRSGQINAKVWDNADQLSPLFQRGDVVRVKGVVEDYQGKRQLKVARLMAQGKAADVDMSELIRTSPHDEEQMLAYLREQSASITNQHLRALMDAFFEDPEFVAGFARSAAARNLHHVYVGGLLEHTVKVTRLAVFAADVLYPGQVDRDIIITAAILHDVGKTRELSSGAEAGYTTEGYLVGHLVLGSVLVRERAAAVKGFPPELLMQLDHILLSHHGEKEWGSPVVPMTPEAMIIHSADNFDAKTEIIMSAIAADPNDDEEFTQYHRALGRHFYKGTDRSGNESGNK